MKSGLNRLSNVGNPNQGTDKKVLCVCSAGLLRSPTMAEVLSRAPYKYNTRACGSDKEYALIPIDDALIYWADEIVFVNRQNYDQTLREYKPELSRRMTKVLDLPDSYQFRHPKLIKEIKKQYDKAKYV